ncbi:MAG: sigma-70 family RNA polymerase sigma factor [Hyphomonadaceae bacterium JAD_PAG50586_4]|nr:MAG: sigma-70 family RNA polymerase sigma factor [Hyphomonadaceae bacterium JAD_PAG50586_4]
MTPAELARLFADEAPRLVRRLRRFRGQVASEDVVQSAFAKMLEVDMSKVDNPRAYLARLTQNLAVDEVRRQTRAGITTVSEERLERVGSETVLTPEQMLIEGERFAFMTGAVLALPERERLALLWFKLKGLSHAEIAKRLGVSRHTVPYYLSRGLAKIAAARAAFERAEATEACSAGRTARKRL